MALGMAALQAIPALTGTQDNGFAWTIYTGDLVSHDPDKQLSRLVENMSVLVSRAQDAPASLGGALAQQFSWNYDHVADLWKHEKWLPAAAVQLAKRHYAGYMVKRMDGLRLYFLKFINDQGIGMLNCDILRRPTQSLYSSNYFNYINMTNPDVSGMLRFLTDELQSAEDAGDRGELIKYIRTLDG
ncbi:hypothetical protein C0989_008856 [Termitomyces sp. Mn162]|nr:hypothetical protein C0989_008856 [Termitomyces sp. Mn162]